MKLGHRVTGLLDIWVTWITFVDVTICYYNFALQTSLEISYMQYTIYYINHMSTITLL